jgi:hypothetical protein
MKFTGSHRHQFSFALEKTEKRMLFQLLQLYPLVPPAHHKLSRTAEDPDHAENQKLLEESLAEQRRKNRRHVLAMLDEPGRFRETKTDVQFTITRTQMEWLLQVLNDIRVGAWLALGEPKELEIPEITKTNAPYLLAMEVAGIFESRLLEALGIQEPGAEEEGS